MEKAFQECMVEARGRGQTVLLSSHILSEVEAICDRVAILRAGRLVEVGILADMRHLQALHVEVELDGPVPDLSGVAGVSGLQVGDRHVRCQVSGSIEPLLDKLSAAGVRRLLSREPSLEELFLAHYGGTGDEATSGAAA
jgi:ABC-2 type transport system ATP-binding protein